MAPIAAAKESAQLFAIVMFFAAAGFVASDIAGAMRGRLSPITVYAFASAITALANAMGLWAANGPRRAEFFHYADDDFLLLASQLAMAGALLSIIGFRLVDREPRIRAIIAVLPRVHGNVSDRALLRIGPVVALGGIVAHVVLSSRSIGTVLGTVFLLPHIIAFLLARAGTERRLRGALAAALVVASLEGARALVFAYLRIDIIAPFVAVALGALLGARSLSPLRHKLFIPLYVFAAVFVLYFGAFAQVRSSAGGFDRLQAVAAAQEAAAANNVAQQTVWSRLTNFNQLSQVGHIVAQDGFLHGETLQYLGFVFVPRFLWPDKPLVQKGGWFAWKIGQAYITPDGRYSNAVNMTVPGELYLNFGWIGVVLGSLLFGAILAVFWTRCSFWARAPNMLGAAFGYYLFWTSLTLAADLQTLVTLLSTYCVFVAVGIGLRYLRFAKVRQREHRYHRVYAAHATSGAQNTAAMRQ